MRVATAIQLIQTIVYKPDWHFETEVLEKRFEGGVRLTIHYPAINTDRENAEQGYPQLVYSRTGEPGTAAAFILLVANCKDERELFRKIVGFILEIEQHEAREAFRTAPTYWAPFHPHHEDGMALWGTPEADLRFGLA